VPSSWFRNGYQALRGIESNQRIRRWVSACVFLCTVAFLAFLLLRSTEELRELDDWPTYLGFCAKGFLLYPVSLIVQALIWRMMIVRLGQVAGGWWDIDNHWTYNDHAMRMYSLFFPTVIQMQRLFETRKMIWDYDYILEKTRIFLAGFKSHLEHNGGFVKPDDVPEDWEAPCPFPDWINEDIFK